MKKLFKSRVKRGLPGGPNEVISDIQGMISMEGYRKDSPDKNKSVNLIPSNHISMLENDGTPLEKGPVMGIDNLGNKKMMYPGGEYIFPGDQVFEIPMFQNKGEFKSLLAEGRGSVQSDTFKNSIDRPLNLVFPINPDMSKRPDRFGYKERRSTVELTEDDPRYKQIRNELKPFVKESFKKQKLAKKFPKESYFTGNKSYNPSQDFLDRVAYQAAHKGEDKMGDTDELVRIIYDDLGLEGFYAGSNTGTRKQKRFAQRLQHSPEWYAANALNELGALGVAMPKNQYGGEELPKAQNGIGDLMKFQKTFKKPTTTTTVKEEPVANSQAAQFAKNYNKDIKKVNQAHKDAGTKPLELTPEMIAEIQKQDLRDVKDFALEFTGLPSAARIYSDLRNDPIQFSKDIGNTLLDASTIVPELLYEGSNYLFGDGTFNLGDKTNVLGNPYGSGLNAAMNVLGAMPLFTGVGKFGQLTAKSFKPGFYPKPTANYITKNVPYKGKPAPAKTPLSRTEIDEIIKERKSWWNSDEYAKRRMAQTGETKEQVAKAVKEYSDDLDNVEISFHNQIKHPNIPNSTTLGQYSPKIKNEDFLSKLFGEKPQNAIIDILNNGAISEEAMLNTLIHEIDHLGSPALRGVPFKYPTLKWKPKKGKKGWRSRRAKGKYFNSVEEQQVARNQLDRTIRQDLGIDNFDPLTKNQLDQWKSTNPGRQRLMRPSEFGFDHVNTMFSGFQRAGASKEDILNFLNKGYATVPLALGAGYGLSNKKDGGEELPQAQHGIPALMKFQKNLQETKRSSFKEKVNYNNQVTKLQNFAEQARKQEAINKAAGVENIKANIPLTPAEKISAVVEPIINTAKKELNPARIYEQLQKSDLGPGFQQAFDWIGNPTIKFGIKTYDDPVKVGKQLLTTASDIAALPYTLPKEYYDSGMFDQMIMNDSEAAMNKAIKRGSNEFNWSNLFDAEAAETSMQGLAAAPFISPMLRGTVKGLSAAPKVIDKAIFPKRVFRARTASGKPNIAYSGEQSALEKELLDKVEKQGAWYTDDIKELGIYLKGNDSRAGIFQGDDMIIDQAKVPFWARNKNILTNKDAMALKKEQGFLTPDEMGGLFQGRINPNEYIIPNSIFYPKTSTTIKAMPKGVAKKPLYYTRPSDGKIVNVNDEFIPGNTPFNDRDFAYFTKPYEYLDDQVQGATGVNPGFYQKPSTMEGLAENIHLNKSASGTISGVEGNPYADMDLDSMWEYFLMNEAQRKLQYPNPAVLEPYENLLARMQTPQGRSRMQALGLTRPLSDINLPSILGGKHKGWTNVPPIVADNTTYGYAQTMPTFDQIALHSAMPKTYGIPKTQQVLRHELEHIISGNSLNYPENTTTIIDEMLKGLKLDGKPTPKTMEPGYYTGRTKTTKPKKLMPKEEFLGNKQGAIDYFTSGSGGNEKSAFLAELQEYMMQKGVIPKQEYTKITPSMIKDVEKIYLKEKAKGEGNLRILDIIKKDDDNYKILAKGLNTMLGVSPLVAPTIMSEMDGGELPKMQTGNGERKRSSLKSKISNLTPADYPKSTAVFHSGTPLTIDQPIVGPNIFQEAMENTKKLASGYDEVKPISKPKTFEIDLSNPKTAPTTLTPLTPSFLERKDVDQIEKNRSNINSLTDENIILRSQLLKNPEEQYVIIDKKNQRLKLYQGDKVAMDFEVVMGKNPGDAQTTTKAIDVNKDGTITDADRVKGEFEVDWSKGNLSTGAGKYKISGSSPTSDPYYQSAPSFYLKNESGEDVGSAIHGSPDYRVPYFGNETLDDNRVSNGCINGKCTDIQALYNMNLKEGTNVYILPEDDGNYFEYVDGDIVFRMSPENRSNYLEYTDEQGRKQKGQGGNYSTNTLKYKPIRSNFDEKSFRDQVFQWNDFNDEGELSKTTKPFINSLVENKQDIMKAAQINSDVYNQIARMAFGIYGAESNYGDSHSALGNFTRAAAKYFDSSNSSSPDVVSKYDTYGLDSDSRSVGYTQIRWSYLNDKEKEALKKLNIRSNKDLFDPKKAATATAVILGVRYNEQLTGDQKKDVWKHLPTKWNKRSNYGTRVKNNARFLKFEQWD